MLICPVIQEIFSSMLKGIFLYRPNHIRTRTRTHTHTHTHTHARTHIHTRESLNGDVSLYHWPPVWLVWNQVYDNWQFFFLFAKQTNPNQPNRRLTVQWYFPPFSIPIVTIEFTKFFFYIFTALNKVIVMNGYIEDTSQFVQVIDLELNSTTWWQFY